MDEFWEDIARMDGELKDQELATFFDPLAKSFRLTVPHHLFAAAIEDDVRPKLRTCLNSLHRRWTGRIEDVWTQSSSYGLADALGPCALEGIVLRFARKFFTTGEQHDDDPCFAVVHDPARLGVFAISQARGAAPDAVRLEHDGSRLVDLEDHLKRFARELVVAEPLQAFIAAAPQTSGFVPTPQLD